MEKSTKDIEWEARPRRPRWLRRRHLAQTFAWSLIGSFLGLGLAIFYFAPPFGSRRHPTQAAVYTGNTVPLLNDDAAATAVWKCIPPPPPFLLEDARVASHPAVAAALANIRIILEANARVHKDAVSVSVVHASKGKLFEFHSGRVRLNESATASPTTTDGDSIYRIASITKAFVVLEALILGRQAHLKGFVPELNLESRLKDVLPEFRLPTSFKDEEGEITLAHLGSHRAGLARDVGEYQLDSLDDIAYPPTSPGILDGFPHNRTAEELLSMIADRDLAWQVGETPSYSNTGFSLLGMAVGAYHNKLWKQGKNFTAIMRDDIFTPLNMDHTFTGPIPPHLRKHVIVPAASNLVDKVFAPSHDPAGGMFSTTNDLSKLLHKVLLASKPELIAPAQRLTWLKSVHQFTDGIGSVGIPWETFPAVMPDFSRYNLYSKGGSLPAQFTEISVLPEFGYGVVALVSLGITNDELHAGSDHSDPLALSFQVHNTLAPAIWQAYNEILVENYVGVYISSDGLAHITFEDGMLVLKQLVVNGVDVFLKWDQLVWGELGKRKRLFEFGAKLVATAFEGQFRMTLRQGCAWTGFDAITTKSGWGMDKILLQREGEKNLMVLSYEPGAAKLYKRE
ncbi:hypothetical protein DRE_07292 [Drechslerella stenobrocha 248]|uniref:Beta-lactamase-related domain-containing protein n=1 Tax=Drechslerella stenobrocha 248 TaxID=1043628 RepID=W7HVB5_9PEZI|nr:hypothetical protein DRE_07292 [Drechslerella stenobrocha 248]